MLMSVAISQIALATASLAAISPSSYTAPGVFPTSVFTKYYNDPTATSAQPQPVVSDPVTHVTYPLSLTDPNSIPLLDTKDPNPLPAPVSPSVLGAQALIQTNSLIANQNTTCAQCQSLLEVLKFLSLAAPEQAPPVTIALCQHYKLTSNCTATHGLSGLGSIYIQVIAKADVGGYDGQAFCHQFFGQCPAPNTLPFNLTGWFAKPKPKPLPPPKTSSGKRLKVLHVSDFHLDPRYATGSESNCTVGAPCCRKTSFNSASPNIPLAPAARFGSYPCDTPLSLGIAALEAIPPLTGTQDTGFDFTIYTGDLVSHDSENELSRDYVLYTETIVYDLFKRMLGSGPVYVALGNHDTYHTAQDAPHSLGTPLGDQFSWNYDHVASLWAHEKWLPDAAVKLARAHYGAFSVQRADGLRIIALNDDFWYKSNIFNYFNMSNPDVSGNLRFLTDELQDAEDHGDRVWIIGHVETGWDGGDALVNPSDLFYQIVDRFSPHVVANIFFGHTHEDEISIIYANNATAINAGTAETVTWMGPSVTPNKNLNSGFRVYEVDADTFDILDAHTWISDVNSFPALDHQTTSGPAYTYEYSTREAYGGGVPGWTANDPLNATWWHLVTEAMETDQSLVDTWNTYQGKSSVRTPPCTGQCATARICYMRSGSSSIAKQNCPSGFGSVQ